MLIDVYYRDNYYSLTLKTMNARGLETFVAFDLRAVPILP